MNPPAPGASERSDSTYFAAGELDIRIRQLSESSRTPAPANSLDPYRQAAAVMVAFNPATLKPIRRDAATTRDAMAMLPELVPSPYAADRREFPWTQQTADRKRALAAMKTAEALKAALAANRRRPKNNVQEMLTTVIRGRRITPEKLSLEQLSTLAIVRDWLAETQLAAQLPTPAWLRGEIDRRRDDAVLQRLASPTFTGREAELAQIQAHLAATDDQLMFISGAGGVGKSALISQALIAWTADGAPASGTPPGAPRTWLRVDLDHSLVDPSREETLLAELAVQLRRKRPDLATLLTDFSETLDRRSFRRMASQLESLSADDAAGSTVYEQFARILTYVLGADPDARVAIWVDTFEEAQFMGRSVALQVLSLLRTLISDTPQVRVIVTGRAPLPPPLGQQVVIVEEVIHRHLRPLVLDDLPANRSADLLTRLLKEANHGRLPVARAAVDKIATRIGGNPLTLYLVAAVFRKQGSTALRNLRQLRAAALNRRLYSRILEHIHNPELRQLAVPGIYVRVITPEVIRHVLAEPCRLGRITDQKAQELCQEFAREITLVETDQDGTLRHRQDIRLTMLAGMPKELQTAGRRIDELAVKFWSMKDTLIARAEEVYHRLRLGSPRSDLDARWRDGIGPYLRGALDEFPAGSPARLWLAERLGVVLGEADTVHADTAEWERQTATEVRRLIGDGRFDAALDVLRSRRARSRGSLLFGLETRVLCYLGRLPEAAAVARHGITRSQQAPAIAVDLLLLLAFVSERRGSPRAALAQTVKARISAEKAGDNLLRLTAALAEIRLRRRAGQALPAAKLRAVADLALAIGPNEITANPAVLRQLAAELAPFDATFMQWASRTLLDDVLRPLSKSAIIKLAGAAGGRSAELRTFLRQADTEEVRKLAAHRIREALSADSARPVMPLLVKFFRDSVEGIQRRDLQPPSRRKRTQKATVTLTARQHKKIAQSLASLDKASLHKLTRYVLRGDVATDESTTKASTASDVVRRAIQQNQISDLLGSASSLAKGLKPNVAKTLMSLRKDVQRRESRGHERLF